MAAVSLRLVTWNLWHGRADPPAGRPLVDEFAAVLGGWQWDAALLQEVPPWWPRLLATRTGAEARLVLTSRNGMQPVRRALACRWPDPMASQGGGANAILIRTRTVLDHRTLRLCRIPERRWLHAVRTRDGIWIGNLHAATNPRTAQQQVECAARTMLEWSDGGPAVLGGDFNVAEPDLWGFTSAGGHNVDHVLVAGGGAVGEAEVLDRGTLSDHAPVAVAVTLTV